MIGLFKPSFSEEAKSKLLECLSSGWIGKGPKVTEFEQKFASKLGVKSDLVTTTNSCTEALFSVFDHLNFPPGSEVVVTSLAFVGLAQAICANGLTMSLADVSVDTLNPTLQNLVEATSSRTRAMVVTHYGGLPIYDIAMISAFCEEREIVLIEDAACAPFAALDKKVVGTFGDFGVWSFDAMKTIAIGDGGMIYCKSAAVCEQLKMKSYLGLPTRGQSGTDKAASDTSNWWEVCPEVMGRRSVMNDISATVGIVKLDEFDDAMIKRQRIAKFYSDEFEKLGIANSGANCSSIHYMYWIRSNQRDRLARHLLTNGIYTSFRYWPIHKMELFKPYIRHSSVDNTELISNLNLNIPMHSLLSHSQMESVISSVAGFFE